MDIVFNFERMKYILRLLLIMVACQSVNAQITITAADMPVAGDILTYSIVAPGKTIALTDTGAAVAWNFSDLTAASQGVDTYRTALDVNFAYALVGLTAYGYRVANASPIPITLPGAPSIENVYTFFEKKSSPAATRQKHLQQQLRAYPRPSTMRSRMSGTSFRLII